MSVVARVARPAALVLSRCVTPSLPARLFMYLKQNKKNMYKKKELAGIEDAQLCRT